MNIEVMEKYSSNIFYFKSWNKFMTNCNLVQFVIKEFIN